MSNRRGFCLFASSCDNIWPGLLALRPAALSVIDPFHLPPALSPECYNLWRPWMPGTMRSHTPREWMERIYAEWTAKGSHPFDGILPLNEPNLAAESGFPEGSREAAVQTITWGQELLPLLRQAWPEADIHSPPLSPHVLEWETFYHWLAPLIDEVDVLDVHTYLDMPRSYEVPHNQYARPVFISECGDRGRGTAAYGQRLQAWIASLPAYVQAACVFVYNGTAGQFAEWELRGTEAEKVLIEAEEMQ